MGRYSKCCAAIAGPCPAWGGVPMGVGSPVAGGIMPSGSGTQPQGSVSRFSGTSTTPTPSSMGWPGVRTGSVWPEDLAQAWDVYQPGGEVMGSEMRGAGD